MSGPAVWVVCGAPKQNKDRRQQQHPPGALILPSPVGVLIRPRPRGHFFSRAVAPLEKESQRAPSIYLAAGGCLLALRLDARRPRRRTLTPHLRGPAAVREALRPLILPRAGGVLIRQVAGASLVSGPSRGQKFETPLPPALVPPAQVGAINFATAFRAQARFRLGGAPMVRPLILPCAITFQIGPHRGPKFPVGVYINIQLRAQIGPPNWPRCRRP